MNHPDTSVLEEYRAGLITGRQGARIAAHLAECEHCTAVSAALAEVSVLLAAAPAPAMPDHVAQRLDTVLAAEAAKRHDSERASVRAPGHRARDPRRSGRDRFRFVTLRVLAPAAAVVAVVAAAFGLTHLTSPTSSSATSAAAPASSASAASSGLSVGRSAEGAAGSGPIVSGPSHKAGALERPSPSYPVYISRTDYQRSSLVHQLEAERLAPLATGTRQVSSPQITGCVTAVTRGTRPGVVDLVEQAHFEGQPAIVIIASSGHGYTAWITGPGCSATSTDVLARTALP